MSRAGFQIADRAASWASRAVSWRFTRDSARPAMAAGREHVLTEMCVQLAAAPAPDADTAAASR